MENKEIARLLWETADLMEIAGEDLSASAATATGRPPWKAIRSASSTSCGTRSAKSPTSPESARGWPVLAEIVERGSCERRDAAAGEISAGARWSSSKFRASGPKSIALIFEHYQIGTIDELEQPLPGAEAARRCRAWAPSWKRRCCARSPQYRAAHRPLSAELCRRRRGRTRSRCCARCPASKP